MTHYYNRIATNAACLLIYILYISDFGVILRFQMFKLLIRRFTSMLGVV